MNILKQGAVLAAVVLLTACGGKDGSASKEQASSTESAEPVVSNQTAAANQLAMIIAARSEEQQQRDSSRHPQQTIEFFGVEPGMTIVEVLPGGGWYTQILAPYVGPEGAIYGVNYADTMWPLFGFFSEEVIAGRIAAAATFGDTVNAFAGAEDVPARGFAFDGIDPEINGTVDAVVMIRALHNLNRFEEKAGTRTAAIKQVYDMLKPDGFVGVVQHRAPEDSADEWANGSNGYLKQSAVIAMFEQAGFELVASSELNANPKDQPVEGDSVWRLPPSLRTAEENKAANTAIGETDRMTLKFVKK
ncbi:class I SAM-dependent methyltransferase [Oceanicoccus sp. KOV_DT_Chl]|uniref:class I SAM-dependent methyltransferase n=1 Tax=Oceanicoccus sp. KOV_DT_Chl TaxID=1904639 RepID=UPI000C7966FC|nr:class I SAM-dependent methyltransferase [Oceanicoccus sp. KOV_DT_Chl]